MSLGCLFHQQLPHFREQGQRREEHTYQTPGPVSELCSLRTMTSHRKPEDGWGHQSLQSGHSCSRQLCLTAPWPASRCHSKNRRVRGLWGVFAVVLKSGNCVFPIGPLGVSLLHHFHHKKKHNLNTQWLVGVPSVSPCVVKVGKGFPLRWWDTLPSL